MGPAPFHGHRELDGSNAQDAAGRLQRAAGSEQRLHHQTRLVGKQNSSRDQGSGDWQPLSEQSHYEFPAQQERTGHSKGLSGTEPDGPHQRQSVLLYRGDSSTEPAQGYAVSGYKPDGQAAPPVPSHELCLL